MSKNSSSPLGIFFFKDSNWSKVTKKKEISGRVGDGMWCDPLPNLKKLT